MALCAELGHRGHEKVQGYYLLGCYFPAVTCHGFGHMEVCYDLNAIYSMIV